MHDTHVCETMCLDLATMIVPMPHETSRDRAPTHREVVLNGRITHYWEYASARDRADSGGNARTLVFVHGFRGDHHGFEAIVALLPEFHSIVPDLPGFGASEPFSAREPAKHDVDGYAGWLHDFVTALELPSRPIVIGHSFGSIIVAAAIARGMHPARAILINPIAALTRSGPRTIMTWLISFYHWIASVLPNRLGVAFLRNRLIIRIMSEMMATTRHPEIRSWIHKQHEKYFGVFANRVVVRQAFRALNANDVAHFAYRVPSRTLLIAAEKDGVTTVREQKQLTTLFSSATLRIIPRVGHLVHYEAPAETANLISQFAAAHEDDGGAPKQ